MSTCDRTQARYNIPPGTKAREGRHRTLIAGVKSNDLTLQQGLFEVRKRWGSLRSNADAGWNQGWRETASTRRATCPTGSLIGIFYEIWEAPGLDGRSLVAKRRSSDLCLCHGCRLRTRWLHRREQRTRVQTTNIAHDLLLLCRITDIGAV